MNKTITAQRRRNQNFFNDKNYKQNHKSSSDQICDYLRNTKKLTREEIIQERLYYTSAR